MSVSCNHTCKLLQVHAFMLASHAPYQMSLLTTWMYAIMQSYMQVYAVSCTHALSQPYAIPTTNAYYHDIEYGCSASLPTAGSMYWNPADAPCMDIRATDHPDTVNRIETSLRPAKHVDHHPNMLRHTSVCCARKGPKQSPGQIDADPASNPSSLRC
jgi:hypothetical protein